MKLSRVCAAAIFCLQVNALEYNFDVSDGLMATKLYRLALQNQQNAFALSTKKDGVDISTILNGEDFARNIREDNIFGVIDLDAIRSSDYWVNLDNALIDNYNTSWNSTKITSFFDAISDDEISISADEKTQASVGFHNAKSIHINNIDLDSKTLLVGQNSYLRFFDELDNNRELFLKTNIFKGGLLELNNSSLQFYNNFWERYETVNIKSEFINLFNSSIKKAFIKSEQLNANNSTFYDSFVVASKNLAGENNFLDNSIVVVRDENNELSKDTFAPLTQENALSTVQNEMSFISSGKYKIWNSLTNIEQIAGRGRYGEGIVNRFIAMPDEFKLAEILLADDDFYTGSIKDFKLELDDKKISSIFKRIYENSKLINSFNILDVDALDELLCTASEIANGTCNKSASENKNEINLQDYSLYLKNPLDFSLSKDAYIQSIELQNLENKNDDLAKLNALQDGYTVTDLPDVNSIAEMADAIRKGVILGVVNSLDSQCHDDTRALIDRGRNQWHKDEPITMFLPSSGVEFLRYDGAKPDNTKGYLNASNIYAKNMDIKNAILQRDINAGEPTYLKFHDKFDDNRELFLFTGIYKNGTINLDNIDAKYSSIKSDNISAINSSFEDSLIKTKNLVASNLTFTNSLVLIDGELSSQNLENPNNLLFNSIVIARDKNNTLDDKFFTPVPSEFALSSVIGEYIFRSIDGYKIWQNIDDKHNGLGGFYLQNIFSMPKEFALAAFAFDELRYSSVLKVINKNEMATNKNSLIDDILQENGVLNPDKSINRDALYDALCTADEVKNGLCDKLATANESANFDFTKWQKYINESQNFNLAKIKDISLYANLLRTRANSRARQMTLKNNANFSDLDADFAKNIRNNLMYGVIDLANTNSYGYSAIIDDKEGDCYGDKYAAGYFEPVSIDSIAVDNLLDNGEKLATEFFYALQAKNISIKNTNLKLYIYSYDNDNAIVAGENTYLQFFDEFDNNQELFAKSNIYKGGNLSIINSSIAPLYPSIPKTSSIISENMQITNSSIEEVKIIANDLEVSNSNFTNSKIFVRGNLTSESKNNTLANSIVIAKNTNLADDIFTPAITAAGLSNNSMPFVFTKFDEYKIWQNLDDENSIYLSENFLPSTVFSINASNEELLTKIYKQNDLLDENNTLNVDKLYSKLCTADEIRSGLCKNAKPTPPSEVDFPFGPDFDIDDLPAEPSESETTKPVEPTAPGETVNPTEPTTPSETTPTETVKPGESGAINPEIPAEKPTETVNPTEPTEKPSESGGVKPSESEQPTAPSENETTKPVEPTAPDLGDLVNPSEKPTETVTPGESETVAPSDSDTTSGTENPSDIEQPTAPSGTETPTENPSADDIIIEYIAAKTSRNEAAINIAHTALAQASFAYVNEINNISKRLGEVRDIPQNEGAWLRGYGGKGTYKDYQDIHYHSVHIGYDRRNDDLLLGVMLGLDKQKLSSEIDGSYTNYMAGLYASKFYENGVFVDVVAKYMHGKGEFTHAILGDEASGKLHAKAQNSLLASAQIGQEFAFDKLKITPSIELISGYISSNRITSERVNLEQKAHIPLNLKPEIAASIFAKDVVWQMGVGGVIDLNRAKSRYELSDNFGTSDTRGAKFNRAFVNTSAHFKVGKTRVGVEFERSFGGDYVVDYNANITARYSF